VREPVAITRAPGGSRTETRAAVPFDNNQVFRNAATQRGFSRAKNPSTDISAIIH